MSEIPTHCRLRPAFNKIIFIKRLVSFLYYAIDNALSTLKARLIEYKSI